MDDVEQRVALSHLLDFYGPLLTEHRREIMRLYCDEDLSFAEIAAQRDITRQGVSDAVHKARGQLMDYEEKLGLVARYRAMSEQAESALAALEAVQSGDGAALRRVRQALENIIRIER